MHRSEAQIRTAELVRPPPSTAPASRLYIHDERPTLREEYNKFSMLNSVSPTSSSRNLTMHSLSSHSSSGDPLVRHHNPRPTASTHQWRQASTAAATPIDTESQHPISTASSHVTKASLDDPHGDELQYIKDSVERLRSQRAHVEQLRHRNERLELLLADRAKENEKLRLQIASMQGVEQENVGLLKSFQLLEERIRVLEATCNNRKEDVRTANERLAAMEKARDTLQVRVDELAVEREHYRKQLSTIQSGHEMRIEELKATHERALEKVRRDENDWQSKLHDVQQSQSHFERKCQDELANLQSENQQLVRENHAMEQRVQQLLATTVRQTTMIEDCDRLLSESKSRHATAKSSYRDQLNLNVTLQEQIKQLEIKLSTCEHGFVQEKNALANKVVELETKNRKLRDKNEIYTVALQEKENLCEKLQNELLVRDRARFHVEEVVKELRQKEKTLLGEISSFKVTMSDLTDEKCILQDQLRGLHQQLEKERNDRSRWATARLKLLAEFCDEENKLSTVLHHHSALDMLTDDALEDVLGQDFDEGGDDDADVSGVVAEAGVKMDALDRRIHSHSQTTPPRTKVPSKAIIFG